jgi:nucleoside-diphosphate-sugar epimerase
VKLAVFGATGMTGGLVVARALAEGHDVVALLRDPARLALRHDRLGVLGGSPVSATDVTRCLAGTDAVIHCLGIGSPGDGRRTTLVSDSVTVVLAAMATHRVPRIVCMSNVGAGGSGTWLAERVGFPRFLRWLRPIVEDKERMEAALRASAVSWVSVRLPRIVEGPEKPLLASLDGRGIRLSITAASAARFLLEQVSDSRWVGSTPSISN